MVDRSLSLCLVAQGNFAAYGNRISPLNQTRNQQAGRPATYTPFSCQNRAGGGGLQTGTSNTEFRSVPPNVCYNLNHTKELCTVLGQQ